MPRAKEVHDMSDELLVEHLRETRKELFGLRFQHATGELDNTARLRGAKRDLARALTIARQRRLDVERELMISE
ncbi:MAG: 50S ribosomal protein L29 [Solirubrobacteraceae bacterium]|nr:MAG: 50S ribosomal protein L29 [Solirubrobacterales bacterium]